jgi:hypothetical protein
MSFPVAFGGHLLPTSSRQFTDGVAAAISNAAQCVLRYNDTAKTLQVSIDGGAYFDIIGVAGVGYPPVVGNSGSDVISFGVTAYLIAIGFQPAEIDGQFVAPRAGNLSGLFVQAAVNSLDGDAIVTLRINGAPTAVRVTIPPLGVALVSDTVNSAVVAAGDLISLEVDAATAPSAGSVSNIAYGFLFTD